MASSGVVEHFWSGDEPLSNIIDMATIGLGFAICAIWARLVREMGAAENSLKHLHRPDGDVTYDDTDHDVWSDYHHEVSNVEDLIASVLHSMVRQIYIIQ
jgi:hypothetical protein